MKRQILFCLLIVSANALLADDTPTTFAQTADTRQIAEAMAPTSAGFTDPQLMPVAAAQPPVAEPMTAPPTLVGPNASPYQPPVVGQPSPPLQPGIGGAPMEMYGNPPCAQCGQGAPPPFMPPGGFVQPGGFMQPGPQMPPIYPYSALTPDVTMVPTTVSGPLPDRAGWVQRYELGMMPFSAAKDGFDRLGEWTFDLGLKYVAPLNPIPATFSFEQQYDLRTISGPSSPPGVFPINLPGSVQRIGWDFELKTTAPGPWNAVVAFNPSIDSDFQKSLTRDAFNWDGRAAMLYSPTRELTYVLGVMLWDRLNERVLPWAGVIYRPNQYWQFDMVFPQFRISTYMWDEFGFKTTLYGRVEYHSEAYQIYNPVADERDRVAMTDWRALIGFNKDRRDVGYFLEGGWIFARHYDYKVAPDGFSVDSGAIVRFGVRF